MTWRRAHARPVTRPASARDDARLAHHPSPEEIMHSESTERLWRRIAEQAWNVASDASPESTVRLFEELVPFMDTSSPDDVFQLASAYYFANNHFKAQMFLEFVIKKGLSEENRPLAILQMADCLRSLGRGEDALHWLDYGLTEYSGQEQGRWFAALKVRTLADLGRVDDVVDMALELLGMPADDAHPQPAPSDSAAPVIDPIDQAHPVLRRRDLRAWRAPADDAVDETAPGPTATVPPRHAQPRPAGRRAQRRQPGVGDTTRSAGGTTGRRRGRRGRDEHREDGRQQ
jgi:hypothetical protein